DSTIISLWTNGAPGFENLRNVPEKGPKYISNIHNPSITVYLPPKEKATGAAVLVIPGGGHRMLVINSEGREPAQYLNSIGIAAVVLKYRLQRDTNSVYKIEIHAKQDAQRAMRTIRSNAAAWGIDPNRLGMMGFSAGGEVVDMVAFESGKGDMTAKDPIDRLSAKPNFVVLVYPGPLGVPETIPADAPPAFLVAANDDICCSPPIVSLLQKYRAAGVSVEAHIYAQGSHAFNTGIRSKFQSLKAWPQRLADWFVDNNYFNPAPAVKK
ncbi:MAG: Endo,4-beta-xylanase, partial [Daejeonella sp.]|nr:Endo,4-beta-xylanase [Daejeonella sp.]